MRYSGDRPKKTLKTRFFCVHNLKLRRQIYKFIAPSFEKTYQSSDKALYVFGVSYPAKHEIIYKKLKKPVIFTTVKSNKKKSLLPLDHHPSILLQQPPPYIPITNL